jgi:acyl-CoA thioester hydrolase
MEPFQVRITVRGYEIDSRGHLNHAIYLWYAEHARWELLRAAGITDDAMTAAGIGPAALENNIRYRAELRAGDEVDVGCGFEWGAGKVFRISQDFRRPDGTLAAELRGVAGMLDLTERRLVADPAGRLRALATDPLVLGL